MAHAFSFLLMATVFISDQHIYNLMLQFLFLYRTKSLFNWKLEDCCLASWNTEIIRCHELRCFCCILSPSLHWINTIILSFSQLKAHYAPEMILFLFIKNLFLFLCTFIVPKKINSSPNFLNHLFLMLLFSY
jgi:hypothetical protein